MAIETIDYPTPTATCAGCRDRIASAVSQIDGVASAALDLKTNRTTIVFDPARIDSRELTAALTDAGYPPEDEQPRRINGCGAPLQSQVLPVTAHLF
jgi:P-type Cu+ transporter